MSSKLLPLILLAAIPTASENLAAGYHIGQQWMNTTTGAMYKCVGDGSWQQSYGYGDSPTFAGLTVTGATNGVLTLASVRNTDTGSSAYTHVRFGNDGDANQGYIYLNSSTNTGLAGSGSINIGGNAALGLIAGGTLKASIAATGVATFRNTVAIETDAATSLRIQRITNDSQVLFGFTGGDWRWAATFGTTGAYADFAWYTSDLKRMALTAGGNLGVGISPDGTYGTGSIWGKFVSISGQFNVHTTVGSDYEFVNRGAYGFKFYTNTGSYIALAIQNNKDCLFYGSIIGYGGIFCTPANSHASLVLGANDTSSWGSVTFNGNGGQTNWRIGGNITVSGSFEFIPSTAAGGSTFSTPCAILGANGDLGLGIAPLTGSGSARWITCNGTGSIGGGLITAIDGVATGYIYTYSGNMHVQSVTGLKLQTNAGDTALEFATNREATFRTGIMSVSTPGSYEVTIAGGNIYASAAILTLDDFVGASGSGVYIGDRLTEGTWRIRRSGNNIVFERRESSTYVTKSTISA